MKETGRQTVATLVIILFSSGVSDHAIGQQTSDQMSVIEENGIVLVLIPPGNFMMGARDDEQMRGSDERPRHSVTITKPFYLGKYEITQAQYEAVMGENPSRFKGLDLPVENVTWFEAAEFCMRLSDNTGHSYRLPTEAEWEYACRAGTTSNFYWGSEMDGSYAWHVINSSGRTHRVGQKLPNPWGLFDICGNAEEWCGDWHSSDYGGDEHLSDPTGPSDGQWRVRRGGCWEHPVGCIRSANRYFYYPDRRSSQIGFRVVREMEAK